MNKNLFLKAKFINDDLISTDDILPAKFKHMYTDGKKLSQYLFYNKYPKLSKKLKNYQVIISNGIFGIGSSREQAVDALINKGIKIIISNYFGRIFFRNSWNLGLIALQSKINKIKKNNFININLKKGYFKIKQKIFYFNPPSKYMMKIIKNKGIINYIRENKYDF